MPLQTGSPFAASMLPASPVLTSSDPGSLRIAPNYSFKMRHHAAAWRVSATLEVPTWIPVIGHLTIAPGCDGIHTIKESDRPEKVWEDAVAKTTKLGWSYFGQNDPIPAEYLPPGVPEGGYLRRLPCWDPQAGRGTYYLEAWRIPVASLPNEDQQFTYAMGAHERWCEWLVATGQVAEILPQVVKRRIATARNRVERAIPSVQSGRQTKEYLQFKIDAAKRHEMALLPRDLKAKRAKRTKRAKA